MIGSGPRGVEHAPRQPTGMKGAGMRELVRTTDPVRLSFLTALLRDASIEPLMLDVYVSAVEGSIGVFPKRLMVSEEDYDRAVRLLDGAGENW